MNVDGRGCENACNQQRREKTSRRQIIWCPLFQDRYLRQGLDDCLDSAGRKMRDFALGGIFDWLRAGFQYTFGRFLLVGHR